MTESNRSVMREVLADENMAIETSHLGDSEYADAAERPSRNRKNLALCNISAEDVVSR